MIFSALIPFTCCRRPQIVEEGVEGRTILQNDFILDDAEDLKEQTKILRKLFMTLRSDDDFAREVPDAEKIV